MQSTIQVTIVHDRFGKIISVNRPAKNAKVVVMPQQDHSLFEAKVDPDSILSLSHTHYVDLNKKALVPHKKAKQAE